MQRTHHRLAAAIAATLAGIALAAAPALAGEDDDDEEDAPVQAPAVPAPVPVQGAAGSSSAELSGAPVGGVETGAGGTAGQGQDAILLGLASGALVLVATGGGLTLASRRTGP